MILPSVRRDSTARCGPSGPGVVEGRDPEFQNEACRVSAGLKLNLQAALARGTP